MHDLNKKEKRICRELMDRSIEKEFETGLKEAEATIKEWKDDELACRLAFHKLRDNINDFRKHLARRYDGLSGSDYLRVVAEILNDEYIMEDDIKELSDEAKDEIMRWQSFWKMNE